MNHWAKVTLTDGRTIKPVGIWIGGHTQGIRLYHVDHGRVKLLASAPGLSIVRYGEREAPVNGKRGPMLPDVFSGPMPEGIERIEHLATCGCSSPMKRFVAPNTWEVDHAEHA